MNTILFKFNGNAYRFNTIVVKSFKSYTRAVSKEEAINNIKSKTKKDLQYLNSASLDLIGTLTIIYDQDHLEVYNVNKSKLILKETCFKDINVPIKFNESIEQTKNKIINPNVFRILLTKYDTLEKIDVTNKAHIYNSCISVDDSDYLYDENEGVYWKDGIPFNDRIEFVENITLEDS